MSRSLRLIFLEDQIALLAEHFGEEAVRGAVTRVLGKESKASQNTMPKLTSRDHRLPSPTVAEAIEALRHRDTEKYDLLHEFHKKLQDRQVLQEPQDIRHFTQTVGLKGIVGKSRKELIPRLMFNLLEQPTSWLKLHLADAKDISERQRQQGFAILTDKLLSRN